MEQANKELLALGATVNEADKAAAGPGAAPPAGALPPEGGDGMPLVTDPVQDARLIVGMLRPVAEMLVPFVKGAPAAEWDALIEPAAALLRHYNLTLGSLAGNPWVGLAVAGMPLALRGYTTWQEVQAKKGRGIAVGEITPAAPEAIQPPAEGAVSKPATVKKKDAPPQSADTLPPVVLERG